MNALREYLGSIRAALEKSDSTEHTHRPALKSLLEAFGNNIIATNEPKRIQCGAPDFNISRDKIPLGHIETKDVGTNLEEIERGKGPHGEQFRRYCEGLRNWILTDYFEFRWFVGGQKRLTARIAELDSRGKVRLAPSGEDNLTELLDAFLNEPALTVGTAKDLAQRMAGMTRIIRHLIINTFEHEAEKGWLHNWLSAFREVLIPDLDEKQFADMFAQTLAYGLFAARVHTLDYREFSREMAAYNLPKTNPFLRKLFSEIAGVDMPETINWAVDDIVELLKHADMGAILKYFGKGKGKEDPVVHFYETFLAAYDPKMREVRGVYYTPEPVVSYIVRSIDHLLKTRFNRAKGLADENTLILDPATGTATFLYFVIEQIYETFARQRGAWDSYVDEHLLNRVFGFELLIAPYAIAHLKLAMQLHDLGYTFGTNQRLGIYLTNTLEEAAKKSEQLFAGWISDEANEAAAIKRDRPILVVLGNPPYSGHSANRSEIEREVSKGNKYWVWTREEMKQKVATKNTVIREKTFIGRLIEDYKFVDGKPLGERNPKMLQDDYVKFIRFAQWRIDKTGEGIIGYITNHGYLDNPTFRGMRENLMHTFTEIYVYDLHGNTKKKERAPDGSDDKNVFDIQQGVAVLLCVREKHKTSPARVFHADLWGPREVHERDVLVGGKYLVLSSSSVATTEWKELHPLLPFYLFVPQIIDSIKDYESGWKFNEAFPSTANGFKTHRDHFVTGFNREDLRDRMAAFLDRSNTNDELRLRFGLADSGSWKLDEARETLYHEAKWERFIIPSLYRPFDKRWVYYHKAIVERPRFEDMWHMQLSNLGIAVGRQGQVVGTSQWDLVFCGNQIADTNLFYRGGIEYAPLYLYPARKPVQGELVADITPRPNFSSAFLKALSEKLKIPQTEPHGLPGGITPEEIFHYAYAVFHSPAYRTRYAEFLKIDFPRLPLTRDLKLFRALATKGGDLVALHLMESPKLNNFITKFPDKGENVVEKVRYTDKDKRVWINAKQYFGGVTEAVWDFHIGGYQVCEKWLKDRKGRSLSYDDIQHYQKIVVAINETVRLMKEIDQIIPSWPIT